MKGVLVDSNIILDIFMDDPHWGNWSESALEDYSRSYTLCINPIIYSEVSIGFDRIEDLESAIEKAGFHMIQIPKEALFLAGKVFLSYRKRKGEKKGVLPDFFIGAHAAVMEFDLITRDTSRYRSYFPSVRLITPFRKG